MKKSALVLIVISFVLYACVPDSLDIDVPVAEDKPVVFSQVIPSSFMTVILSQSFSALNFSEEEGDSLTNDLVNQLLLQNAEVVVSYRDQADTLEEIETGVYASLEVLQYANETYNLFVRTAAGDTLTSQSTMLEQVVFDTVFPIVDITPEDTTISLGFNFSDIQDQQNWYAVSFYVRNTTGNTGIDPNSYFNRGENLLTATELISDQTFETTTYTDTIELTDVLPTDSIVVTLSNISEAYFRYLDIRKETDNFFQEVTKEPIDYPTNVTNGYGFFLTHYPDVEFFDLNEY